MKCESVSIGNSALKRCTHAARRILSEEWQYQVVRLLQAPRIEELLAVFNFVGILALNSGTESLFLHGQKLRRTTNRSYGTR